MGNACPLSAQFLTHAGVRLQRPHLSGIGHRYARVDTDKFMSARPSKPPKLPPRVVCTENLIRVDAVMESPKLAE
jgi:hypothetical protein